MQRSQTENINDLKKFQQTNLSHSVSDEQQMTFGKSG